MNIAVVYGSTRTERRGIKVANFVVEKLKEKGHNVDLIDPMVDKFPSLDYMYNQYEGDAPEVLEKVHKIFEGADAFVIVSAEYNHSIPPALKNIIDHYSAEYKRKVSAIVSYSKGPFAGMRAAMNWRNILGEIGTVSIPTIFGVSSIDEVFDENGKLVDDNYNRRIERFIVELEWYSSALKEKRKSK
jgi:NAD(P)H-dependent FMN reductase